MAMFNSEMKKGYAKLKEVFGAKKIVPAGCKKMLTPKDIQSIIEKGECEFLDTLDQACQHLVKSWRTRYTAHKTNDFSSVQSKSHLRKVKFYSDIEKAVSKDLKEQAANLKQSTEMVVTDEIQDEELKKKMKEFEEKIRKETNGLLYLIKTSKTVEGKISEELANIKKGGATMKDVNEAWEDVCNKLSGNIAVAEFDKKELRHIYDLNNLNPVNDILMGISMGGAGLALGGDLLTLGAVLGLGGASLVGASLAGAATMGVGFVIMFAMLIAAWACRYSKRLGTMAAKRYISRIENQMARVIKCTNDAAKYVRIYAQEKAKEAGENSEMIIGDSIKAVIKDFLKDQKDLWDNYTDFNKRGYTEESKSTGNDLTHRSGLRTVLDNKQDSKIGILKLSAANTWENITPDRELV